VTEATAILTTWTELIATTLPGVDRVQFYGAPPKDLLIMFSIWPADSLVLLMGGEAYAQDWVLDPIHLWARMEEGNMALLQLPRYDAVYPRIDAFAGNDDVIFAPPPSPSDYTMMTPPPSYAEATSSLIKSHLLRITTETLRERTYENEKKKKKRKARPVGPSLLRKCLYSSAVYVFIEHLVQGKHQSFVTLRMCQMVECK